MNNEKLKPCPFCGGEAFSDNSASGMEYIQCNGCSVATHSASEWNTRHHIADARNMVVTDAMVEAAEEAYMPFGDMNIALHVAFASQSLGAPIKTLPHLLHDLACDAYESADAEIWNALVDMFNPQWQPIETAPLSSCHPHYFLIYTTNHNTLMGVGLDDELCYLTFMDGFTSDPATYGEPTHWMPLPKEPTQ